MQHQSLAEFLECGWSDGVKIKLREMAAQDDVKYLVAWDNAGRLSASAFTAKPSEWPDTAIAIWAKNKDLDPGVTSRTMLAVELVERDGLTVYAASKKMGINQSAVHRAIKRRADKNICPHCNQVIKTP